GIHHQWPGNSLKVRCKNAIPTNEWVHLAFTYDGSSHAAGVHLFVNGYQAEVEVIRDHLWKDITYDGGEPDLAIGFRFRDVGLKGGRVDDFRLFNRELTVVEVAQLAGLALSQREKLFDFYVATVFAPALKLTEELHQLRQEQ